MNRIFLAGLALLMLVFTSCETTKEIIINADGTGNYSNTLDLSSLIGLAKMSGGEGMEEMEGKKVDTSISLKSMIDSLEGLTDAEKTFASRGNIQVKMDMDNSIMKTKLDFPFKNLNELIQAEKISGKTGTQALMDAIGKGNEKMGNMEDMGMPKGSIDDYYDVSFSANSISKKLIAAKYETVGEDEGMQALKEMAGQGMSGTNTIIIKLPKAAKKAEGKSVTLSEDKKTVTIKESAEDFFDDGKNFEFYIEY